ncbi:MAG: xanthine dehydrogenase family protein subunit M [Chloroflexi bacterium]|nr:xanthine dehydrogenase family protein subunit M [Chloroflexota bacterium]
MHPFDFVAATSVADVNSVLAQHGNRARPLVGGTDLLVQLRGGRFELDAVVDIKSVPEANVLELNGSLKMGSAVPLAEFYENQGVRNAYPGLIDCAELVGGIQIQSRASMAGNLCNATPSGDTICPMIVHSAQVHITSAKGDRTVAVEDFCTGPGRTVLEDGEWVLDITFPAPASGFGAAYERFIPRNEMDIAVVGVASSVTLDGSGKIADARVALAAVGPTPVFIRDITALLVGKEPTEENFVAAGKIAHDAVSPITDMRGTIEQRRHLSGVLTRRTLTKAAERAKAG